MFDKVLASVRIGGAEVDALLDKDSVEPGETLPTRVVVDGGKTDQDIEHIDLELRTRRERGETHDTYEISSTRVTGAFTIGAGERRVFETDLPIHPETPVTAVEAPHDQSEVWIDSDLAIDRAIDADDSDQLAVEPTAPMQALLDAVSQAGHELHAITVDDDRIVAGDVRADLPVDQEFVFRPVEDRAYSEIEVHFLPGGETTQVLVEFDAHHGGERVEVLSIDHDDYSVDSLRQAFEEL
jgi:sporulation-control protein